jgi:hypothetical protein
VTYFLGQILNPRMTCFLDGGSTFQIVFFLNVFLQNIIMCAWGGGDKTNISLIMLLLFVCGGPWGVLVV